MRLSRLNKMALLIALFSCYMVPYLLFLLVGLGLSSVNAEQQSSRSLTMLVIWWTIFGPMAAGYVAASLAKAHPLGHGLVVAGLGFLPLSLIGRTAALWPWFAWLVLSLVFGLFGAWIWHYRARKRS